MSERSLYIGVDLREVNSQLALLAPQGEEPKLVFDPRDKTENTQIPTVVTIPGSRETVGHFLEKIVKGEPIFAAGVESDPVNVLAAYFQKILSFTRREYPEGMIRRLVVTTKYRDFRFISQIYQALEKLGIGKDRAMVVDRRQCFVYYVMNQKKDLWVNQVGVFDYEDHEITYFQMHVDRYQHPPFVTVMERQYPDYVKMLEEPVPEESGENARGSVVEAMVKGALHGQVITTVYMTGKGFADGFADAIMTQLCVGRHVFRGDNLYVFGACFIAREYSGEKKMEPFLYMDEDTIPVNITMQAYTNAKVQEIMLAKAGTPWYQVDYEVDLIADGEEELQIRVYHVRDKSTRTHILPMDGIQGRLDRKARIGLQIRFAGVDKCIFTIRDKGFGNFFPSSHRIWEETIIV